MQGYNNDLFLSWDEFQAQAVKLAALINATGRKYDVLVAITRGGMFPAGIIARELDIRLIDTFCMYRYKGQSTTQETILKQASDYPGKSVLVVDDLADKGKTIETVRQHLPGATVATLFVKPLGKPMVDLFAEEVPESTWVRFPWDTHRAYRSPLVSEL